MTSLSYMTHLNHIEKTKLKNVNVEILNDKILRFNIRFHIKYDNLIKNNFKLNILRTRFKKFASDEKMFIVIAFLSIIIIFHNVNILIFYLHFN